MRGSRNHFTKPHIEACVRPCASSSLDLGRCTQQTVVELLNLDAHCVCCTLAPSTLALDAFASVLLRRVQPVGCSRRQRAPEADETLPASHASGFLCVRTVSLPAATCELRRAQRQTHPYAHCIS